MNYKPDFLIKPYEVHACAGLRPSDSDVYAVIYWFERLKDGKCTAGNDVIADVARLKERTIGAALERLEKHGFIERVYADESRARRLEIRTLVHMTRREQKTVYTSKSAKKIPKGEIKPGGIIPLEEAPKEKTPGEVARAFFDPNSQTARGEVVDQIVLATGGNRDAIVEELKKFYRYWTEPNKSGTKVKWELEQTFDIMRRIRTWLERAGKYGGTSSKPRAGAGATI